MLPILKEGFLRSIIKKGFTPRVSFSLQMHLFYFFSFFFFFSVLLFLSSKTKEAEGGRKRWIRIRRLDSVRREQNDGGVWRKLQWESQRNRQTFVLPYPPHVVNRRKLTWHGRFLVRFLHSPSIILLFLSIKLIPFSDSRGAECGEAD